MSRPMRHRRDQLIAATAFVLMPTAAHAYVDPGAAGFIVTSVLGALAAGGYIVREYWGRLKRRVFRSRQGDGAGGDEADSTEARPEDRNENAQG